LKRRRPFFVGKHARRSDAPCLPYTADSSACRLFPFCDIICHNRMFPVPQMETLTPGKVGKHDVPSVPSSDTEAVEGGEDPLGAGRSVLQG
jgi:hypothetical protein